MSTVTLTIDGHRVQVDEGTTVAVAMMQAGIRRESVTGEPREPACGTTRFLNFSQRLQPGWVDPTRISLFSRRACACASAIPRARAASTSPPPAAGPLPVQVIRQYYHRNGTI